MKALDRIALLVLIIGGLNWLLIGVIDFDLVATIFGGQQTIYARIVYIAVGVCALYCLKYFTYVPRGYRDRSRL